MEASILDLRRRMADILRALDRNESIKILYRGRQRATLIPAGPSSRKRIRVSDHCAFGMWKDHDAVRDVSKYVRDLRKRRTHAV